MGLNLLNFISHLSVEKSLLNVLLFQSCTLFAPHCSQPVVRLQRVVKHQKQKTYRSCKRSEGQVIFLSIELVVSHNSECYPLISLLPGVAVSPSSLF